MSDRYQPTARRHISIFLAALVLAAIATGAASAAANQMEAAQRFVALLSRQAVSILEDPALSKPEKKTAFRTLLTREFDLATTGRVVLGPYWRRASAKQRQRYIDLFEAHIMAIYVNRLVELPTLKVEITEARAIGGRETMVISTVSSPRAGQPIRIGWRVARQNRQHKVVDLIIEGVSMALSKRTEFQALLNRHGGRLEALLVAMSTNTAI